MWGGDGGWVFWFLMRWWLMSDNAQFAHFIRIGRNIVNVAAIELMEIGEDGSLALYFTNSKKPVVHIRGDEPQIFLKQLRDMKMFSKLGETSKTTGGTK